MTARMVWGIRFCTNYSSLKSASFATSPTCNKPWIIRLFIMSGDRPRYWTSAAKLWLLTEVSFYGGSRKRQRSCETSKISRIYILSLFKWHAPSRGQQLPAGRLCRRQHSIYSPTGGIYILALWSISSWNSFNAKQRGGLGGGSPPCRCRWHHLPVLHLTGQQLLCHPLGSYGRVWSPGSDWSCVYWGVYYPS